MPDRGEPYDATLFALTAKASTYSKAHHWICLLCGECAGAVVHRWSVGPGQVALSETERDKAARKHWAETH